VESEDTRIREVFRSVQLNPNAVVTMLVHDGYPIVESWVILRYLNKAFPSTPLQRASEAYEFAST